MGEWHSRSIEWVSYSIVFIGRWGMVSFFPGCTQDQHTFRFTFFTFITSFTNDNTKRAGYSAHKKLESTFLVG